MTASLQSMLEQSTGDDNPRKGGGDQTPCGEGGHHHKRVDGILPLLRVNAGHRPIRKVGDWALYEGLRSKSY